jgi:hypothetical protein
MAIEGPQPLKPTGLVAGADLRLKQYHFVKLSADRTVVACDGVTDKPLGVLQGTPNTGQAAEVVSVGETKIVGDADLTAGDLIGTSADGQAAAYVAGTDTTKYLVGQVLEGNGAAGGLVGAVINCASVARGA